jgi:MFS family permease
MLAESLSWRWIFLLYLPIGGVALFILRRWEERRDRTTGLPTIDVLGAFLLMGGISVLLLYIQALSSTKGGEMSWFSPNMLMLGGSGFLLLAFFVWQETRTREPILPLGLFRVPVFAISIPLIAVASMAMFAGNIFLPQFFQFVQGTGPTLSGIQLFPLQLGSVAGALGSGWLIGRIGGYKQVLLASLALTALMLAILGLVENVLFIHAAAISVLVLLGVGFGAIMPPLTVAVQNAVERRHLGAATAGIGFFRSLGGLIGVAIFGSLYAASLDTRLNVLGISAEDLQSITNHDQLQTSSPLVETVLLAVSNSFQIVFLVAAVLAAVALAMALLLKDCRLGDVGKLAEDDKVLK